MNNSTGNMYKFHKKLCTYNPIKGTCLHDCNYCFMKNMRRRFNHDPTLRLDAKELSCGLGSGKFVFVGSSTDDFAENVPSEWIDAVLNHLQDYSDNEYMLQTKNPARFLDFIDHKFFKERKDKLVLCTTIESDIDHQGVSKAPTIAERVKAMQELSALGFRLMVTVEPIMDFTEAAKFTELLASFNPIQVNIGANTSRGVKLMEPSKAKILNLIQELEGASIAVHQKSNLGRLLK